MSPTTPDLSQARYGTLLRLLWSHIQPRRRVQLALLVALMLLSSFAELLTVASLVPFLVVLSDPSGLWRQPWVRSAAEALGFSGPQQLILPITLLLMAAGVVACKPWLVLHAGVAGAPLASALVYGAVTLLPLWWMLPRLMRQVRNRPAVAAQGMLA